MKKNNVPRKKHASSREKDKRRKGQGFSQERAEMEAANAPDVEESATKEPAVKRKRKKKFPPQKKEGETG